MAIKANDRALLAGHRGVCNAGPDDEATPSGAAALKSDEAAQTTDKNQVLSQVDPGFVKKLRGI